ncbi:hypothetical protein ABL78_2542 [Leptomonas seymouri]|uniref:Uncharacterized protein n=1 Tax=Leptomonas seymouri TaxID=5684 RepID=A0A0N0P7I2_LEPSE|nr:hypothetical protein ABL78_2542 [Leptomonas seymouri]|eukprot:KPI88367.1 hypothetical protein ABL78_2542 [Leptomonas seymouri]
MELQQHLFNRREIVAILLDLDDETLRRTDFALPLPPVLARAIPATYVPPQTRLDVAREALIAFISSKLRSAPNSSFMSFGLYAVRGEGRKDEDVVAFVSPTSGSASGRAVQDALRGLTVGSFLNGTHAAAAGAQRERTVKSNNGNSANAAPYSGVLRCLQQLKDTADAQQQQQQQQHQAMNSMKSPNTTAMETADLSPRQGSTQLSTDGSASAVRGGANGCERNNSGGIACVVVHGIAVRSRSAPPPNLPWPANAASTHSSTSAVELAEPSVWLDVMVLDGSLETSTTMTATVTPSREGVAHRCQYALLDPVELTGVKHRGLALGAALARVMSLPEARTSAFVHRPLSFLKILRSTSVSSDAVFTPVSACKSTQSNTPTTASGTVTPVMAMRTPRGRDTSQQPQLQASAARGAEKSSVNTSVLSNTVGSGGVAEADRSGAAPSGGLTVLHMRSAQSQQLVNQRKMFPRLTSGSASQGGGVAPLMQYHTASSPRTSMSPKAENGVAHAALPVVAQRSTSAATSPTSTASIVKGEERDANRTMMRMSSIEDKGVCTRSVSPTTVASGVRGPAARSFAMALPINEEESILAGREKHLLPNELQPSAPPATSRRAFAASSGPVASPVGQSPACSPCSRRPPSVLQAKAASTTTAASAGRYASASTITQAPQGSAVQQQKPWQHSSLLEQPSPSMSRGSQPPLRANGDDSRIAASSLSRQGNDDLLNPHKMSDAISTGVKCFQPSPMGATGRRVGVGAQAQQAPPTASSAIVAKHKAPPLCEIQRSDSKR